MNWDAAVKAIRPHVVRIHTQSGWGSGFLAFYNTNGDWCCIATADHVIAEADEWRQPIQIQHEGSVGPLFLEAGARVIWRDTGTDSAIVLCVPGHLRLPKIPVTLMPMGQPCGVGVDVGWVGYPNIDMDTLCFFSGSISAVQQNRRSYLIDGVSINGISGGPVFHCPTPDQVQVIGIVSAYHANRTGGQALPGLLRAQDVSHFHDAAQRVRSIDEARAQNPQQQT